MKNIEITVVEDLLAAMKSGDESTAKILLDELTQLNDSEVVHQVEEIAHNLSQTMQDFGQDAELMLQTKHDLPDVSERLDYVMQTTEEASNKTLSAAENCIALVEKLNSKLIENPNSADMAEELQQIQSQLTDIMMFQSFQDLIGQVLNRVMTLVGSLEMSLIGLIENSGVKLSDIPSREVSEDDQKNAEMTGVGPNVTKASKQNTVASQDDVDDLLGSLGI